MTASEQFGEAIESIRANLGRSVLTMLGIIIGVAALITMLSVGAGAQARIVDQISSLGANLLMVLPVADRGAAGPGGERVRRTQLSLSDVEAIARNLPEVAAAAPALQGQARLVYNNRNWPTRFNGTTADYFYIRDWPLVAGRIFSGREEVRSGKVAVIGATVAERLFGATDPIGQEVRLLNAPMQVIGLLTPKGPSGSGRDQDDIVFVPYKTALQRLGAIGRDVSPQAVSYILAKAASDEVVTIASAGIEELLRHRHRVPPGSVAGFRVADPVAAMDTQRQSARTIAWLLAIIASISLVVGGISIMNIMLVSVAERTREIGLRMALGARRRDVSGLFLAESLLICTIGACIGVAIGFASSWVLAELSGWPVLISMGTVLLAVASAAVVGLLFGYFPARKAARLLPASALRRE